MYCFACDPHEPYSMLHILSRWRLTSQQGTRVRKLHADTDIINMLLATTFPRQEFIM